MALYAVGQKSHCLKRKVGAVIRDEFGNVFSSGYNEVPKGSDTCRQEHGECYRDLKKRNITKELSTEFGNGGFVSSFLKKVKYLDLCRSLHAEENAILNIARFGTTANLINSTLYTTTYPCNLCANKIAQLGIGNLVYFEPYPVKEAKELLTKNKIVQKPFEGVTFRAYFKVFG